MVNKNNKIIGYRVIGGNVFGREINVVENMFFSTKLESAFNILKANDEYDMKSNNKISKQKFIIAEIDRWREPCYNKKFGYNISTDDGEIICEKAASIKIITSDEAYEYLLGLFSKDFISKNKEFLKMRDKIKNNSNFKNYLLNLQNKILDIK